MDVTAPPEGWSAVLLDQLTFHWDTALRPKLEGLTDEEYFWEPVAGCWSVRQRSQATAPILGGSGDLVAEFAVPEPDPPPVTTIAWRLVHLIVGVFGMRNASHFGGPPIDYFSYEKRPRIRTPRSCSTSIVRSSTTARRSCSCATCTAAVR